MIRAAIYARISKRGDQNPESQLQALRTYAANSGFSITREFIDTQTGITLERPGLAAMLTAADQRQFDMLLFFKLDRLTRTGILDTLEILRTLRQLEIHYHSLTEPLIRSTGPLAELNIAILATIAAVERESIRERTLAGLERARQEGKPIGRPRRILSLDRLQQLQREGKSYAQMADLTGASRATVIRRLKPAN